MTITVQYFEGCPHWETAVARVREVVARLRLDASVEVQRIDGPEAAEAAGFRGSPTVLVDGVDPFPGPSVGWSCRTYATGGGRAGAPGLGELERALRAAAGGSG